MDKLKQVAELLLEKEKIEGDEFDALFEEKSDSTDAVSDNENTNDNDSNGENDNE